MINIITSHPLDLPNFSFWASLVVSGKELSANAGDEDLITSSKRSVGEGDGNPLQYSCLENPMDKGAWRAIVHKVTKSDMTKGLSKHIP